MHIEGEQDFSSSRDVLGVSGIIAQLISRPLLVHFSPIAVDVIFKIFSFISFFSLLFDCMYQLRCFPPHRRKIEVPIISSLGIGRGNHNRRHCCISNWRRKASSQTSPANVDP